MEKEIKIVPPKGYEIDKEKSTFDCIKLKSIQNKKWRDDEVAIIDGYYITYDGRTNYHRCLNIKNNWGVFATKKQAKSALAMARISQIMANDERFGGTITDEEWKLGYCEKYSIYRRTILPIISLLFTYWNKGIYFLKRMKI